MLLIGVLFISIATACIPLFVSRISKIYQQFKLHKSKDWLPVVAGILFTLAWFIPDVRISHETTTFQQHFVGGGFYCALLYAYFKLLLNWKFNWLLDLIILFAWTSAFGVANELLEFTLTKLHLAQIGTGDTDWDLLANTLGAFIGYAIYTLSTKINPTNSPHSY
jgi:hypothetical protein